MKSPVQFAFFMAMPIEAANMYFRGTSVDARFSIGPLSLEKLLGYQFEFLHWPGLYVSGWLDRIGFSQVDFVAIGASGYIDTVLLLIACIFVLRWSRPKGRRRPPSPTNTSED
jgi:hypothetical protein